MADELIQQLSQLIADDIQSAPSTSSIEQLVRRLQQDERIEKTVLQINTGDSSGVQALVSDGGIANVGIHIHDFDTEKLEQVLSSFWKSLQIKKSSNNLPRSGVAEFVGREKELCELHVQMNQADRPAITAIRGMGGVGKTELALQYAQYHRDKGTYSGGICWLQAKEQNIIRELINFATDSLQLKLPEESNSLRQVQFCWRNWPREGNVLIVIDDVYGKDDLAAYNAIKPYLPPQESRFWVLLTTRLQLGTSIRTFELDVLSKESSLFLLESLIGTDRINLERNVAKALCCWLGYLPLGIELVGRFLVRKQAKSLIELQEELQSNRLRARALCRAQPDMTATHEGVAAAFELSWQDLGTDVKELAYYLSLYALSPISWAWIEAEYEETAPYKLEDWRDEGLINRSLLTWAGKDTVKLHQLIREFISIKVTDIAPAKAEKLRRQVSNHLAKQAKSIPESVTKDVILRVGKLTPHIIEITQELIEFVDDQNFFYIYQGLGRYYEEQGLYDQAEKLYRGAKKAAEARFGLRHINTLKVIVNLSAVCYLRGYFDEAEEFQRQLLLYSDTVGFDKLVRADILNGLGLTLVAQGDYQEAENLYDDSMQIRIKLLGEEHPDVSDSLNNIGLLHDMTGNYQKAESLFMQAIMIRKKSLGEDHVRVADCQNNLASCYLNQGRYEDAKNMYFDVLEAYERLYGEEHIGFATALNNLAAISLEEQKYDDANIKFRKVMNIQNQILGEKHPDVCTTMSNLAYSYEGLGQFEQAEKTYKEALQFQKEILSPDHINIGITMNNLAKVYQLTHRYTEAELAYLDAVTILKKILGDGHQVLNKVKSNLEQLRQLTEPTQKDESD